MAQDGATIVLNAFKICDKAGDGLISRAELRRVFRALTGLKDAEIEQIITIVDKTSGEMIRYEDFLNWMFGKKVAAPAPAAGFCAAPKLSVAEAARGVQSMAQLLEVMQAGGCSSLQDIGSLEVAVQMFEEAGACAGVFFSELLPFICDEAARYEALFPQAIAIVDVDAPTAARTVEWSQRQCLCILCNSFLCAWPSRTSRRCRCIEAANMPSINFDEMFSVQGRSAAQAAKCQMFLHYVQKQRSRIATDGDAALQRRVRFLRAAITSQGTLPEPSWCESAVPLCKIETRPLRTSIDAAKALLRADFANELVGGGSIGTGCVQEEIMFACHPELNCTRLVFTAMLAHEAFVLCGAEQFAEPSGYGRGLGCSGAYDDPTAATGEGGILASYITAIDAVDYRAGGVSQQYSPEGISRELLKAYAGFAPPLALGAPDVLATGNWGAGAFAGDACLKVLIQWAAASQAGISELHYFPFDRPDLLSALPALDKGLREQGVTVGQLLSWLLRDLDRGYAALTVFRQLDMKFGTSCSGEAMAHGALRRGDNVEMPTRGLAKIIEMTTTDAMLEFRDGSRKWYDVEDLNLLLSKKSSSNQFKRGDSMHLPFKGKVTVVEATDTHAQLKFEEPGATGGDIWHDVEDLTKLLHDSIVHKLRRGDSFQLPGKGRATVARSNTTDVQLEFLDGSSEWFDVQDCKRLLETSLQAAVGHMKYGEKVKVPGRGMASVIEMTTTDVKLQFPDESKKWYDIEDFSTMMCEHISSSVFEPGQVLHMPGKGKVTVLDSTTTDARLRYEDGSDLWLDVEDLTTLLQQSISHELRRGDTIQFPGKGEATVIESNTTETQFEFADGTKVWYDVEDLAELLERKIEAALGELKSGASLRVPNIGLGKVVEMTTTDVRLQFDDGCLRWFDIEDLSEMMTKQTIAGEFSPGDSVNVPGKGQGKVIDVTTTDVKLQFEDGSDQWYDVEDLIDLAFDTISHKVRRGDILPLPGEEKGLVTEVTTTEVQLQHRDGSKKWYDIEDLEEVWSPTKRAAAGNKCFGSK